MIELNTPVTELRMVGKALASRLNKLGIFNVEQLLTWYPFRYDDFSRLKTINQLQPGETATIKGKIELLTAKRSPRKKMMVTECFVSDQTGSLKAVWFGQPYIVKTLQNNDEVYLSGQVADDLFNLYFKNPSYEKVNQQETSHTARLVPIYSLTDGLSQKQMRFFIRQALPAAKLVSDWLPDGVKQKYQLLDLEQALIQVHFPTDFNYLRLARRRLKFDELLNLHLQNYLVKKELETHRAMPLAFDEEQTKKIVTNLPFTLTDSQRKAAWQILLDMSQAKPMNRLLQGDVGSGKTVVAALAAANTVLNNCQAVLLSPTEILAEQHFQTFKEILKVINANLALLTHNKRLVINTRDQKIGVLSRSKLLTSIAQGEINLIIGTHALLQEDVNFKNLGLVIVDEQHRFGVQQRQILRQKSGHPKMMPHFLSMTATPIPRSLALTIYGDLDLSPINELPKDRKQPITRLVEENKRNAAYDFILEQIKLGRQAFVVCPLIDESDKLGVKAATAEQEKLSQEVFPQLAIGLLHGKLKPADKDQVMKDFLENKIQILVATSVVEVGVNVPNANVMIIESAERFGLAQLHQFRGRVNRSSNQAFCFLFTDRPSEKSTERLKKLVDCFDGFKLAEEDLKIRGAGDLSGIRQSGFMLSLKIASLSDSELIAETKEAVQILAQSFPEYLNHWHQQKALPRE